LGFGLKLGGSVTARPWCFFALVLALAWGCTPIEPAPEGDGPKEQPATETEAATSFAGVWKRPDTKAEFKVEDDGEFVNGKLVKGTWMWIEEGYDPEELFDRFEFRLQRDGEALKGTATFRFVGDAKDYESAWRVSLSGEELKATIEELEIDDAGEVAGKTEVEKTFAFEPAIPPAPPTVAHGASDQGGFQMDLTKMIKGPAMIPLGEGAEIGFRVEIETQAAGHVIKHFLAVVGEEGESWRLESSEGLAAFGAKDSIMGLVVEKSSGKVSRAVIGKAGEAGKELALHPMAATPTGPGAEGDEVDVEIPAGTFPARLIVTKVGEQEYKSWVGREGDLEGVLLKYEGPDGKGKALEAEPETQSLDLGETVEARRCIYDNGDEIWHSSDEVVKALAGGMVRYKASGVVREIKVVSSKAESQLKWD
jgi:hypothetical protein